MSVTWDILTHTLTTRIAHHLHKESSFFRHLDNNLLCKEQCTKVYCFRVLDNANFLACYQRGFTQEMAQPSFE